ncbi:MAG: hypothetical protein IJG37_00460 [Synergistaceae bacterium]|nr:hypothetical protein [Synergistaceae bacterium]MBQ6971899.1 hypothetical protein [Synergistaceae bacterium]
MKKTALTVLVLVMVMGISAFVASAAPLGESAVSLKASAESLAASAESLAAAAAEAEAAASADAAVSADVKAEEPAEFDFLRFAKERVLPDFHPTVKIEDAQADFDERPFAKGDSITRAKIGIYYKGWLRQHSMLIEMDYRAEDRKVRVNVLKDTNGLNLQGARFFKDGEWVSIAAMGWK